LKGATVDQITGNTGAEVRGIQLSQLTDAGKDELALFVAKHKVVAFRDQDFADLPIQEALDFAGYFGRHHIHPTSGAPEGFPEVHLVHRGAEDESARKFFEENTTSVRIHSDVTYEQQPPGTTFLILLDGPPRYAFHFRQCWICILTCFIVEETHSLLTKSKLTTVYRPLSSSDYTD
jgi:sulfonate dioxygenase